MNSASVKLSAGVSDCVSDPQTVATLECVNTHPAVDLLLLTSFAHAASTEPVNLPHVMGSGCHLSSGCMVSGGSDSDGSASLLQDG